MSAPLFRDAYLQAAGGTVTRITDAGGIVLDACVFYPAGGGQPGDLGRLAWPGGGCAIAATVKGDGDDIVLIPADGAAPPPVGAEVVQHLDWELRHRHMRVHTALHLLSVVIPLPVSGGAIGSDKGRLDFDMPQAPDDKDALQAAMDALIAADHPVGETWITETELDANPGLVKTMSVAPPRGAGRIRLVRIGAPDAPVDLQPCGGTHVASTGEIGAVRIGKIEKKGARNRRVYLHLA